MHVHSVDLNVRTEVKINHHHFDNKTGIIIQLLFNEIE